MMTDPIADMLTRIRNAQAVKKQEVIIPFSKIKYEIAKLLAREGYLNSAEKAKEKFDVIKIELKYSETGAPAIEHIKRISKPGQRIYVPSDNLPRILSDMGLGIISTSSGIMTNKKAKRMKIGGEFLFEIW